METIEIKDLTVVSHTYRVRITRDSDAPNPLTDWSEMGTILSLNHRHGNFDPSGVEAAISSNPDAVPLSYFEHGQCVWAVAGELPAGCRCPWDSVSFAGVWIPDAETLQSARNYGGRMRQLFMRKRARQACEFYTDWCNGEIYGYEVERLTACNQCGHANAEVVDSCWGLIGRAYCLEEATAAVRSHAAGSLSDPPAAATF
jgi:hypothetical protein